MFGAKTLTRHADLVNRMADTVGADLPRALAEGRVSGEEIRSAVLACTGCDCPEACGEWLDQHPEGAKGTPSYCRNSGLLESLAGTARE